ncbi:hypothetical protein AC579_5866 [Pseudocercospora musae]|uniref:Uncharacterized protein n=1 Tax=Pseudocercospora musae TaxID=113226 RepID=A0A139ILE7_9PEZI|nr:hypothetical protein AC579_5866 [Pseudocercospora musae]
MATYQLTVHQLLERLAKDDNTAASDTCQTPKRRDSAWSRSSSVSSTSQYNAFEMDFTDYNYHGNHEALSQVASKNKEAR